MQFLFWILDVRVDEKGIHFAVDVLDWDLEATEAPGITTHSLVLSTVRTSY